MAFPGSFQPRQALKLATKKDKDGAGTLNIVVNSKWAAKDGKKVVAGKKDKEKSDKDKSDRDKDKKDKDKKPKLDKRSSRRDVKDKDKKDKDSKSETGDEASGSESYSFAKKRGDGLEESTFQVNGEDYHLESEAEVSEGEDEPSMWGEAPDKTEDYLSDSDDEGDKVEFKKDSSSADLTSSSASKDDKKKKEDEEKKKKEEADKKKKEEDEKKKKEDEKKKKEEDDKKKKQEEDDKKKKEDADKKKKEEDEKKKKEEEDKKKKDEEDKDKRKSVRGFGALFGNKDKDAKDKDKDSKDKDSKDKDSKDKDKRDEKSDKDKSERDKSDRDRDRSERDRSDRDRSDRDRSDRDRDRSERDSKRDSKVLTSQPSSASLSGASKDEVEKLKADFSKKEEKLQKEISEKKEQITKLENELSVAKVQIQQDQDLKQWDRKPQDKQKAELKDLQEVNRNLLVKNEQLEKDNKTMKTEQDSLKRQQKRLEEELSELKEELDAAKAKGSSSSKSSSKESPANDRSEELNKKISSLQRKLDDQQDTNKKQQETIKQLESDLKKAQSAAASRPRDSNEEKVIGIVSSISKGQELDSLKDRINALQDEIDNFHHVEDWVYGAEFKYDGNGKNITASELANYITDHALLDSDDLDKRDFLFHLLKATVRSYRRDINNVDRLSGWLAWMITLYNSLAKSTGAEKIDKKGLDMKFSSLPSMMSALHGRGGARRSKADRSDSDSDDQSSSEEDENGVEGDIDSESLLGGLRGKLGLQERPAAFLAHLEGLVQHCYALIYSQICSELHEIKYMDILFDQSEVFHTSKKANESSSDVKKSSNGKQKANNRIKLTKVLNAAYRRLEAHHNNKTVVAQLFAQVFYFMANSVLNKFLTTPDLCRASRAYAVKVAYSHMEIWASEKSDLINHMRTQFDILLEACNVLVIDKSIFAAEDIIPTVFLKLNPKQIKQLLVSFQPDEMAPDPVPSAAKGAIERAALKVNKEIHLDSSTLINLTQ
eukprot:TRINITY_DN230_c0_g1_i2.p1 TRINITY_DN230_c0_g1~~TRINITY_DN230_c0_g1_i2.p1  ORF type:complete len:998 (+),score=492.14 TRINITY_DN230_c0_g1_i2:478-3471(+)